MKHLGSIVLTSVVLVGCVGEDVGDRRNARNAESFFRGVFECDARAIRANGARDVSVSYPSFENLLGRPTVRGLEEVQDLSSRFCQRWMNPSITIHESVSNAGRVVLVWSLQAGDRSDGRESAMGDIIHPVGSWGGISYFRINRSGRVMSEIGEESTPGPMARILRGGGDTTR